VLASTAADVAARVARRRAIAGHYDAALPASVRPLPRDPAHPVHHYVVRVRNRDAGRARLAELGVETAVYYPLSLARQPALAAWPQRPTPVADALASEWLALPVHEGLSDADVATVVACVREVFGD
jgi:dTDP-4-amino-4,6-dideoxygalactose transaminase